MNYFLFVFCGLCGVHTVFITKPPRTMKHSQRSRPAWHMLVSWIWSPIRSTSFMWSQSVKRARAYRVKRWSHSPIQHFRLLLMYARVLSMRWMCMILSICCFVYRFFSHRPFNRMWSLRAVQWQYFAWLWVIPFRPFRCTSVAIWFDKRWDVTWLSVFKMSPRIWNTFYAMQPMATVCPHRRARKSKSIVSENRWKQMFSSRVDSRIVIE